jgi:hypothetical protein
MRIKQPAAGLTTQTQTNQIFFRNIGGTASRLSFVVGSMQCTAAERTSVDLNLLGKIQINPVKKRKKTGFLMKF